MIKILSAALVAAGMLAQPVHAEIVTYEFSGTISTIGKTFEGSSQAVETAQIHGRTYDTGQAFIGVFSYATDAPLDYDFGLSTHYITPGGLKLEFANGLSVVNVRSTIRAIISNDRPANAGGDGFGLVGFNYLDRFSVSLNDTSAMIYTNKAMPDTLSLTQFDVAKVEFNPGISDAGGFDYVVTGGITSLTRVSPVPEPSMALLLLGGFGVIGARRLAQRRRVSLAVTSWTKPLSGRNALRADRSC